MHKTIQSRRRSDAGVTMIETMMAGAILIIGSLSLMGLIVGSITTNNRNKIDSTQAMLAQSIAEHINSNLIGDATSTIVDCAGTTHDIDTYVGGANLNGSGSAVDFTENIAADAAKDNYHMDFTVKNPCSSTGALQGIYDVRWRVQQLAGTNTYIMTVSSRLKNHGEGNRTFSAPVTLRIMSGNWN
jgi:Tfp pilus assembly protein PilV